MNASNQRHSMPFYISPRLFRNKRLRQRRCRWAARLKKIHLHQFQFGRCEPTEAATTSSSSVKTDRQLHQLQYQNKNRHLWTSLQADVTIDLLSDDDDVDDDNGNRCQNEVIHQSTNALHTGMVATTATTSAASTLANHSQQNQVAQPPSQLLPLGSVFLHPSGSFQLSMVPNITLVPVQVRSPQNQQQLQQNQGLQHPQQQQHQKQKSICIQELQQQQQNQNQMQQLHHKNFTLPLDEENSIGDIKRKRKSHRPRKRYSTAIQDNNDVSIVLSDDDDDENDGAEQRQYACDSKPRPTLLTSSAIMKQQQQLQQQQQQWHCQRSSPPPLAPLSSSTGSFLAQKPLITSETIEEVTVSLVPRTATTSSCARLLHEQQAIQPHATCTPIKMIATSATSPASGATTATIPMTTTATTTNGNKDVNVCPESTTVNGSMVDDCNAAAFPALPDETTVHTVIANRIYELSLSKLREGLASSGMPEFANEASTQKISPTQRQRTKANVGQPVIVTPPPAPISLKLSSDLSISLISDDDEVDSAVAADDCERSSIGILSATAHKAHAAVKLLQKQHPQLSVVQHLQYQPGLVAALKLTPASTSTVVSAKMPTLSMAAAAVASVSGVNRVNAPPNVVVAAHGHGITPGTTTTPRRRKLG